MKKSGLLFLGVVLVIAIATMFCCGFNVSSLGTFFGDGGSADLPVLYKINYCSNYPDGSVNYEETRYGLKEYLLENNMFSLSGYDFIGWNTNADGSGINYVQGESVDLDGDIYLYALWEKIVIKYGDVNNDGLVTEDDYLLLDSYILGNVTLDKVSLRNADVNVDGKIDMIDVDIIKQFCLGTLGYVGILPDNPILKYDIYDDNSNEDVLEPDEEDVVIDNDSSGGGSVTGGGSGTGSGGGNSSGGTGSGNAGSSGSNTGSVGSNTSGGNSGGSNVTSDDSDSGDKEDMDDESLEESKEDVIKFEFKYMIGNLVYSVTECSDIVNGECSLVLPKSVPNRDGYNFLGWSLDSNCLDGTIINNSVNVDKGNIYYACFREKEDDDNSLYIWIVIAIIWITVGVYIYRIVSKHRKEKEISE